MKTLKHIFILSCLSLSLSGCGDFLDVNSDQELSYNTFFESEEDCRAYTAGLYNAVWFDFGATFNYLAGEARSNNYFSKTSGQSSGIFNRFSENSNTDDLETGWDALYSVADEASHVLNGLDRAIENGVSQEAVNACKGEARFMRGLAYWYLTSLWGNVPIVENPDSLAYDYVVRANRQEDVLQFAIRDMEYAAAHLPETDEPGRVTRYSALGMLSRFYITAACYARGGKFTEGRYETAPDYYYDKAAEAALEVCRQGSQYRLMENYEELFRVQNNNNSESLFAIQYVPGSTEYGVGNRAQTNLAYDPNVVDGLHAYGGNWKLGGDLVELMDKRGEEARLRATGFYNNAIYDYLGAHTEEGYWRVSGISNNECNPKKEVVGGPDDTDGGTVGENSGFATPMLRLAEVYLLYAEAVLGTKDKITGATAEERDALNYFNQVRQRARMFKNVETGELEDVNNNLTDGEAEILPLLTTLTQQDIWDERRCELAGESQFWYDIVRRAYWDTQWVLNYLSNQKRQWGYSYRHDDYKYGKRFSWRSEGEHAVNAITEERLLLPYPLSEITMNPDLREEPVAFDVLPEEENAE